MSIAGRDDRRLFWTLAIAVLVPAATLPLLFVSVPPLIDAPGHLGQFAVQLAPADSPLHHYFAFHWALRLNLGTDVLVALIAQLAEPTRAFWLVTLLIPALIVAAVVLLAIVRERRGGSAAAASWALPLAYCYQFSYGFLNYLLGLALSFIGYALWLGLERRRGRRELLFWMLVPLLLVCHAIGGGLLPLMIVAHAVGEAVHRRGSLARLRDRATIRALLVEVRPVFAAVPMILLWKLSAPSDALPTRFDLLDKWRPFLTLLRDQSLPLDLASTAAMLALPFVGRRVGARYQAGDRAVVLALLLLYLLLPFELTGAAFTDMRIAPALMIAALALQDWSGVAPRLRRAIAAGGVALFLVRVAVAVPGYVRYERSYAAERAATIRIARGSKVLALVTRRCGTFGQWRMARLDHVPAFATIDREAWVNAHWDIGDIHLLRVTFRPSPDFYDDPSHYVWPERCLRRQKPPRDLEEWRNRRRTIEQVMPELPLDRVDYLWLIQTRLPAGRWRERLWPVWSNGGSTLYRTHPAPAPPPARGLT